MHYFDLIKEILEYKILFQIFQMWGFNLQQFADQVKIRLISQLIKGISKVFQKLLKYFNGTIVSMPSILPLVPLWPVIFALKLIESV